MLKKTTLIVLFFLIGTTVHSQVLLSLIFGDKLNSDGLEFGLEGGVNWSEITAMEADKKLSEFNLGFYFDIRLKNQWHLDTGVLVKSSLGVDHLTDADLTYLEIEKEEEDGSYSQVMDYFIVPILIKYKLKNRMYFEAGPQVGWMRESYVEFNHDSDSKEIITKEFNTDKINRIDAGLTLGTGYKLMDNAGMTLGIKYYIGMVDVYKNKSGTTNNSFFLKLNVPIGANKKKEK